MLREEKYTIEGAKKLIKNYSLKEEDDELKKDEVVEQKLSKISSIANNEMSLFANEILNKQNDNIRSESLKEDLLELRTFLKNLLDNM